MAHVVCLVHGSEKHIKELFEYIHSRKYVWLDDQGKELFFYPIPRELKIVEFTIAKEAIPQLLQDLKALKFIDMRKGILEEFSRIVFHLLELKRLDLTKVEPTKPKPPIHAKVHVIGMLDDPRIFKDRPIEGI